MSRKIPASVYIICQNEEVHIQRVLESVKDFDEIVIIDSGSTDSTLEIAKAYAKQKEYAKNLCKNAWVLNLDADEVLTPELKTEILETIAQNDIDGLNIKISSRYLGDFNHPFCKFNRRVRFFRKEKGYYPEKLVHESIVVEGMLTRSIHTQHYAHKRSFKKANRLPMLNC